MLCRKCRSRSLPTAPRQPSWGRFRAGVAVFLLVAPQMFQAQDSVTLEYRAKANYLAKFPSFVEWPESALPHGESPFLLCVFGNYPFGISLAEFTRGATTQQRRVETRWIRKEQDLHSCQILFISRSEQKRYRQVLEAVSGQVVLTVGETPDFLDAGGILCFSMQQGTLRFEVDLDEANKAHLKISSRLLALARHVVSHIEAAKS